jgi:hypothetical protein
MSSYLTSLRRLLPTSLSEDSDLHVNSENDSHVSRVLRAYYTEKGRPFPAWLGPDPNAASKAPIPLLANVRNSTDAGSLRASRGAAGIGGGGGLGDLFGDGNNREAESLSLRQRRPGMRTPAFTGGSSDSIPYPQKVAPPAVSHNSYSSTSSAGRTASGSSNLNVRPLPSQREGSYQSRLGTAASSTSSLPSTASTASIGKESSVQERLKARLGGGNRNASPVYGNSSTPPPPTTNRSREQEYDPYNVSNYKPSTGGSFNPYEETGNSGSRQNPYGVSKNDRNPYAGTTQNTSDSSKAPYTSATSPWVTGDDPYSGSSYGVGGSSHTGSSQSSYAPNRRGPGLPNSPRRGR